MGWFVIAVSGTPGTGKTYISEMLSKKFSLLHFDVNNFIKRKSLSEDYDKKRHCYVVDEKLLSKEIVKETRILCQKNPKILMDKKRFEKEIRGFLKNPKKTSQKPKQPYSGIVIDSHLSHYLPKRFVDLCIITKTEIKTLKKRLKKRKYLESKITENLQAEIFDVCYEEALQKKHNIAIFKS